MTAFLTAPAAIQIHALAALTALVLGIVQFALPKGTGWHRRLGWTWVALMLVVSVTSFWIHTIRQWNGFSAIHLLSIATPPLILMSVARARRHQVTHHRIGMTAAFIGGLVIAGAFTLMPGRLMHQVVFGP